MSLSQADIPDLDLDDFVGFLTNDRELNPEESDHFKSLFSGRLAGIDDPLPSMMLGGSRQGSALQSGRATSLCYAWLQHRVHCILIWSHSYAVRRCCWAAQKAQKRAARQLN